MIVFDLDDTLYTERDYVRSGIAMLRANAAYAPLADGKWTEEMQQTYRDHRPRISLRSDAAEALEMLRQSGERIGLITDGRSNTQRRKIEALGLDRYIAPGNILISGETGHDKTSPKPFETLQERNPGETRYVYIGDNPAKDFLWPNRLGWTTVMLVDTEGVNVHSQELPADADYRPRHTTESIAEYLRMEYGKGKME